MTTKTYEIINLNKEVLYKGIAKFERKTIEATSPLTAIQQAYPTFHPRLDKHGMGSVIVKYLHNMKKHGIVELQCTFNLFPLKELMI